MAKIGFDLALPTWNEVTKKNSIVKPATITKTSNIFDFWAWSVASVNPTKYISKNIFDYTPTIAAPKPTTTISSPDGKKPTTPWTTPGYSLMDRLKNKNVPVFTPDETTRKQYAGAWYDRDFLMKRMDGILWGTVDTLLWLAQGMAGPVAQTIGWWISPEISNKMEWWRQSIQNYRQQSFEQMPYMKSKYAWLSLQDAIKGWQIKDPEYVLQFTDNAIGQVIAMAPSLVISSGIASLWTATSLAGKIWKGAKWALVLGSPYIPLVADEIYDAMLQEWWNKAASWPLALALSIPAASIEALADKIKIKWISNLLRQQAKVMTREIKSTVLQIVKSSWLEFFKNLATEELQEQVQLIMENVGRRMTWADIALWTPEEWLDRAWYGALWASPFWVAGWLWTARSMNSRNKQIAQLEQRNQKFAQEMTSDWPGYMPVWNNTEWTIGSAARFASVTDKYEWMPNTQKISDMENRLQEINTEFPSYDLMPIDIKTEKVAIDMKLNEIKWIQEAKFQTMQEVEVENTPIDQASEPYQGPKEYTSKLLEDLTGKTTIATQYVKDFLNRADVKQAEKNVINEVLQQYEWMKKVNVAAFWSALEKRLFKIKANMWYDDYSGYGDSASIFDNNPDVTNYEYDEAVYTMPYSPANNSSHYRNVKDYFWHVRQYDVVKNWDDVRYIIEKQSDLTQWGKWANLSPELWFKKYKDDLQSKYSKQEAVIKNMEKEAKDEWTMREARERLNQIKNSIDNATFADYANSKEMYGNRPNLPKKDRIVELKKQLQTSENVLEQLKSTIQEYFVDSEKARFILESAFDNYSELLDPEYNQISERVTFKSWSDRLATQWVENNSYIIDLFADYFWSIEFKGIQNLNAPNLEAEKTEYILQKIQQFQSNLEKQVQQKEQEISDIKSEIEFMESWDYDRMNQDIYDNQSQWHKYILRGEIQRAINDGKKELYLPTGQSIPYYEWWMNADGIDVSNASHGDSVEIYGEEYIYLWTNASWEIRAIRETENTNVYSLDDIAKDEINNLMDESKDIFNNADDTWLVERSEFITNRLSQRYISTWINGGAMYANDWEAVVNRIKDSLATRHPSYKEYLDDWRNIVKEYSDILEQVFEEKWWKDYDNTIAENIALKRLFWDNYDGAIESHIDNEIETHFNQMTESERDDYLSQIYTTVDVEDGRAVVSDNPDWVQYFDQWAAWIDPHEANFEDENFQEQVEGMWWVDWLWTAKYYEYVLPKEIKDLSKQYWYTRSKERDSNGLEHYVIDLESISEKRKDKPIPAFQRRSQSKVTPITPTEALSIVREYFDADEVPVEFVNQIVTPEWMQAFGKYYNSMISFASSIDQTTPRHEVFHAYFDMFTSESQKKDVISFTRKTSDYQSRLWDKKDNAYNVEEYLADKFDAYVRENQMPKSMKWKIKDFFDKIIDSVKKLFWKGNKMEEMFMKIINKNRDYMIERGNFEPKYMVNEISDFLDSIQESDPNLVQEQRKDPKDMSTEEILDELNRVIAERDAAQYAAIEAWAQSMMDGQDVDALKRRNALIKKVHKLVERDKRWVSKVGKNRMRDQDKAQIKYDKEMNETLEAIMEEYNYDMTEADAEFRRMADLPIDVLSSAKDTTKPKRLLKPKAVKVADVSKNKTWVYARQQAMKKLQEDLWLSGNDMNKYVKVDYTTLPDWKWESYYDRLSARLAQVSEKKKAEQKVINTISQKRLKKENNIRQVQKINIDKATIEELYNYANLLSSFNDWETFLWKRNIETIEKNTDWSNMKTIEDVARHIAESTDVSYEDLMAAYKNKEKAKELWVAPIQQMSSTMKFLYGIWADTVLAKSDDVLLSMMAREYTIEHMKEQALLIWFEDKFKDLMKKSRKSRGRKWKWIRDIIAPEDHRVFDYLEVEWEIKEWLAKDMTEAELDLAKFLAEEFDNARDYLETRNQLKTRYTGKYITHIMRSFLETIKHDWLKTAIKELTKQENVVDFWFAWDTDQVLWQEKFFKYALRRTWEGKPSKNLNKSVISYFRTYHKKRTLDKIIPKIVAYSSVLGDSNTNKFVKQWLNNKKWRSISEWQWSWLDVFVSAIRQLSTLLYIGGSIPISVASIVGTNYSNWIAGDTKSYALWMKRSLGSKWTKIAGKYKNIIGRSSIDDRSVGAKTPRDATMWLLFSVMREITYRWKKQFLLWQLTKEEYKSWEISPERQADIKLQIDETYPAEDAKWIQRNTITWKTIWQFKSWAVPYVSLMLQNSVKILQNAQRDGLIKWAKSLYNTREWQQLIKSTIWTILISRFIMSIVAADDDDDDENVIISKLRKKILDESTSSIQAINPLTFLLTPPSVGLTVDLLMYGWASLRDLWLLIVWSEIDRYKQDGKYWNKGDIKSFRYLQKTLNPAILKQLQTQDAKPKKKKTSSSSNKSR